MTRSVKTFEDLEAYKSCRELRLYACKVICPELLSKKEFDLVNQLKRAARSITANIAEGYGRFHFLDNAKFCSNARGSANECMEHIITAYDEDLISESLLSQTRVLFEEAIIILNGYISYLQRSANNTAPQSRSKHS